MKIDKFKVKDNYGFGITFLPGRSWNDYKWYFIIELWNWKIRISQY